MAGPRKSHTIVAHLAVFGASILLPVLALFAIVLWLGFAAERGRIEDEARDGARNIEISLEQEIGGLVSTLRALATSPSLYQGDLRAFHQQMVSLSKSQNLLLSLRDLNSNQLLTATAPFGSRLPPITDSAHDRVALERAAPAVSGFFVGAVSRRAQFGVVVPVFHDGIIVYLLGTASPTERLVAIARGQVADPRFLVRIVDRDNRILAAIPEDGFPGDSVGQTAPDSNASDVRWTAVSATNAPWRIDVGVPADALYGPLWGRLLWLVLGAGALVGIAGLITALFAHRIGGAVDAIAGAAAAVGRGERVSVNPTTIRELDEVLDVLDRSAHERDRREAELIASEGRVGEAAEALVRLNADLERQVVQRTDEREKALHELFETRKLESIGQLTGGVAHDFNNLLMAILASVRPLRRLVENDPRARRLADAAIEGAERGAGLTQRLLAFARRQDLSPTDVDVTALLNGMDALFRASVGPSIEIVLAIDGETPWVHVDRNQLELAVLNLVLNARDAMPDAGTITVSAEPFTASAGQVKDLDPGDYVRIAVSDTGVGMSPAVAARAIEPFYTTKGTGKGTGLGLSMVHGLAAQSGGAMSIISTPGRGTSVEIYLRRATAKAVLPRPRAAAPARGERAFKIIVVDDDALVLAATVEMLEDAGQIAVGCSCAEEALSLLRSGRPVDVVVTDYAMPGMDGAELARLIRSEWGIPVIVASGYAEFPGGDLPRLHKPYCVEELIALIGRVVAAASGTDGHTGGAESSVSAPGMQPAQHNH